MSKRPLNNRIATEEEANAGEAIFFIPDQRSEPYTFGQDLPIMAKVTKLDEHDGFPCPGTRIQIVQAEKVDGKDVVLGFLNGEEEGICMLEDVQPELT